MKNLKRALSFALASVMLVGMMVVGAGAASFTDADKIQHAEAVNTMVALGLIGGRTDGSYDPTATITRAEMAKLLCTAMNGGRDPQLDGECQFEDVKAVNHWASGYIQYCVNMGYVNGRSATVFDPDAPITAQEAAKMLLTAIGYSSENEKFTGAGWGGRVDAVANTKGLYDDVLVLTTAKLSRDDAAQIVWNAMDADMVVYDWYPVIENGVTSIKSVARNRDGVSILTDRFKMNTAEGFLSKVVYSANKGEYTYYLTTGQLNSSAAVTGLSNITSTKDYTALFGDKVEVLYKPATVAGNEPTLYGLYSISGDVITSTFGAVDDKKDSFKTGGVTYDIDDTVDTYSAMPVYTGTTCAGGTTVKTALLDNAATVKFIDQNDDGKYDYVVAIPATVGKVTYVGTSAVTVGGKTYNLKKDVDDVYKNIAKDDYAVVTPNAFTEKVTITMAEMITGKVDAVRNGNEVQIDGAWYEPNDPVRGNYLLEASSIGSTYKLATVGGYYYDAEMTIAEGATLDVLYISAADNVDTTLGDNTIKAKAWFTDGSSEAISITKVNGKKLTASATHPAVGTFTDYGADDKVCVGAMYRYEKNTSGEYNLLPLHGNDEAGRVGYKIYGQANGGSIGIDASADKFNVNGNYTIADDSVFFVQTTKAGKEDVQVVSGKSVKTWGDDAFGSAQVLANTISGFRTVRVGSIITSDLNVISGDASRIYGYITAKTYVTHNSDKDRVIPVTVWTKDGEQKATITSVLDADNVNTHGVSTADLSAIAKGKFISYEVDNKGNAIKVDAITSLAAVTALDRKGENLELNANGNAYAVNDDTIFIYVDSDDTVGYESGALQQATETVMDNKWVNNVVTVDGETHDGVITLKVVFVDVNNCMNGSSVSVKIDRHKGETATYIARESLVEKTVNVKNGTKADELVGDVATVFGNVMPGTAAVLGKTNEALADGDILRMIGTDGTVTELVITVNNP